jgi:predicted RNA binding protein YcfA (HicA-like mRNA interferase family)
MVRLTPVSRKELISRLRRLGFEGPYAGGSHEFMLRGVRRLVVPNLHRAEIGVDLLARILRQAGITREQWLGASAPED